MRLLLEVEHDQREAVEQEGEEDEPGDDELGAPVEVVLVHAQREADRAEALHGEGEHEAVGDEVEHVGDVDGELARDSVARYGEQEIARVHVLEQDDEQVGVVGEGQIDEKEARATQVRQVGLGEEQDGERVADEADDHNRQLIVGGEKSGQWRQHCRRATNNNNNR